MTQITFVAKSNNWPIFHYNLQCYVLPGWSDGLIVSRPVLRAYRHNATQRALDWVREQRLGGHSTFSLMHAAARTSPSLLKIGQQKLDKFSVCKPHLQACERLNMNRNWWVFSILWPVSSWVTWKLSGLSLSILAELTVGKNDLVQCQRSSCAILVPVSPWHDYGFLPWQI